MATFAEVRRRALGVMLDAAKCGEWIVLIVPGAGRVSGRALVAAAAGRNDERTAEAAAVEAIDCRLAKDPLTATQVAGAAWLVKPWIGLGLLRADDDRPYSYCYTIEETPESWLLRFERRRIQQVGMRNQER